MLGKTYETRQRGDTLVFIPKITDGKRLYSRDYMFKFYSQAFGHAYKIQKERQKIEDELKTLNLSEELIERQRKLLIEKYPHNFAIETSFADIFAQELENFKDDFYIFDRKIMNIPHEEMLLAPKFLKNNYNYKMQQRIIGLTTLYGAGLAELVTHLYNHTIPSGDIVTIGAIVVGSVIGYFGGLFRAAHKLTQTSNAINSISFEIKEPSTKQIKHRYKHFNMPHIE